jgi:hypothetical protein
MFLTTTAAAPRSCFPAGPVPSPPEVEPAGRAVAPGRLSGGFGRLVRIAPRCGADALAVDGALAGTWPLPSPPPVGPSPEAGACCRTGEVVTRVPVPPDVFACAFVCAFVDAEADDAADVETCVGL